MKRNTVLPARVPSSPSTADDLSVRRFASPGLLLGLVVMVVTALAWLMPARMLDRLLVQEEPSGVASLAYLRLLAREHPEHRAYSTELAKRLVSAGRYREAMETLAKSGVDTPERLDLYLTALERAYFQADPVRREELKKDLTSLMGGSHRTPAVMKRMLKTALSLGDEALGEKICQWLLDADLTPGEQTTLFRSVVEARLAAGDSRAALKLACGLLPHVASGREVYRFMTGLALQAAEPACAVHFARLLVGIPEQENRCPGCSI